jgi:general secretion pathway protein G
MKLTRQKLSNGVNIFRKKTGGFTLIELLVVIAIIGILASVVLASLNTARRKSRDARRIADIKQLQLSLELYFDGNSSYPIGDEATTGATSFQGMAPQYIPSIPADPLGGVYQYKSLTISGTTVSDCTAACNYYHIGASLEEKGTGASGTGGNPALAGDRDLNEGITGDFNGANADCAADASADDGCYDVTP